LPLTTSAVPLTNSPNQLLFNFLSAVGAAGAPPPPPFLVKVTGDGRPTHHWGGGGAGGEGEHININRKVDPFLK
jgi:hypothetical protein